MTVPKIPSVVLASALLAMQVERACAHGDLHEQIANVSAQIEKDPTNADLYLRRGELRRLHSEFPEAASDLGKADSMRPDWPQVALAKARLALSSGSFESTVQEMGRLLPKHPEYPEGWLLRARANTQLGRHSAAANDYTEIIRRVERPEPEIFLERAAALASSGNDHLKDALLGLNEGLAKLGSVMTLELAAYDLELKLKHTDDALRRIDRLTANSRRQESWLSRRGDILVQTGRIDEARVTYGKALEAIASLPPHIQGTAATTNLKQRISESLARLKQTAPASAATSN